MPFAARTIWLSLLLVLQPVLSNAADRAFSAQDTVSVCIALSNLPEKAVAVLQSEGWETLPDTSEPDTRDAFAAAFIATEISFPARSQAAPLDAAAWKKYWPLALEYIERSFVTDQTTLLKHVPSNALLRVSTTTKGATTEFRCLLAVPQDQIKASSYFPKLTQPTAPELSVTTAEAFFSETIRSIYKVSSGSIDSAAVSRTVGVETDIAAAFSSSGRHPDWVIGQ